MKPTEAIARFKATARELRRQGMLFYDITKLYETAAEELVTEENTGKQEGS